MIGFGTTSLIGAQGTIAIAEALKVNAILTKLWLGGNYWGDAGGEAVRDAVKDRSGIFLMVIGLSWSGAAVENKCASTLNMCGPLLCVL